MQVLEGGYAGLVTRNNLAGAGKIVVVQDDKLRSEKSMQLAAARTRLSTIACLLSCWVTLLRLVNVERVSRIAFVHVDSYRCVCLGSCCDAFGERGDCKEGRSDSRPLRGCYSGGLTE